MKDPSLVLVDETKQRDYRLLACTIALSDASELRATLRGVRPRGAKRNHMRKESPRQKRLLISTVARMPVAAVVYEASRSTRSEREARDDCLRALVADLPPDRPSRLMIDLDDSLRAADARLLIDLTKEHGLHRTLSYEHRHGSQEELLAIPDVLAWCQAKGGVWRSSAGPAIRAVKTV